MAAPNTPTFIAALIPGVLLAALILTACTWVGHTLLTAAGLTRRSPTHLALATAVGSALTSHVLVFSSWFLTWTWACALATGVIFGIIILQSSRRAPVGGIVRQGLPVFRPSWRWLVMLCGVSLLPWVVQVALPIVDDTFLRVHFALIEQWMETGAAASAPSDLRGALPATGHALGALLLWGSNMTALPGLHLALALAGVFTLVGAASTIDGRRAACQPVR